MSDRLDRLARASVSDERVSRKQLMRPTRLADSDGDRRLDAMARALTYPMPRRRMLGLAGATVAGLALSGLRPGTGSAQTSGCPEVCAQEGKTLCCQPKQPIGNALCCYPGDTCFEIQGTSGEPGCCRPHQTVCENTLCCEPGETCGRNSGGFPTCLPACPQGRVRCREECCREGEECRESFCQNPCPQGRVRCGEGCCPKGEECHEGRCRKACPRKRVRCGKRCCPKGEKCYEGRCRPCPPGQIKCKKCCPPREGCDVDTGECICPNKFLCKRPGFSGKGVCCGMEAECIEEEGRCCPYSQLCRKPGDPEAPRTCCEPGQHCVDGRCESCPPGTRQCGKHCCSRQETCKSFDGGFVNLCTCPRGSRSCGTTISGVSRQCCPDSHRCTETGCERCPRGTHSCGRMCCPNSLVCNWPLATACVQPERVLIEEIIYLDDPVPEERVIRLDRPATRHEPFAIAGKNGSLGGLAIRCRDPKGCSGTITLTEDTSRRFGAIVAARRSKTVARARYRMASGATKTVRLRLDRTRLKQLKKARFLRVRPTIADARGRRRYPSFLIYRP